MKKLESYVLEYRRAKSTDEPAPELKKVEGKPAKNNGSKGLWGISEPTDDDAVEPIDPTTYNNNMRKLAQKFDVEEDFFIMGEAGWGKTSIIEQFAKQNKRIVITVYLHQAQAEDLAGIPVPVKDRDGNVVQKMAMPDWAKVMKDNPDKQFLLFFDEMNQAAPDVMNALMPIVLKHEISRVEFDNFFVGAAGNFERENEGGISDLSGPLNSRFKPIIIWETDWDSAIEHLKKEWKDMIPADLFDLIGKYAQDVLVNPRELERNILKYTYRMRNKGTSPYLRVDDVLQRLQDLAKDNLTMSQKKDLAKMAEGIYQYIQTGDVSASSRGKARKDISMVPQQIIDAYKNGIEKGFIKNGGKKYGVSKENIHKIELDDEIMNAEMLDRLIANLEKQGLKFKYLKDDEWRKAGLEDPLV